MKQTLDLRLGQHLTITPQLQQAIRLLQLSSLELQQEIQEALENNPLLEEIEGDGESTRNEENAEPASEPEGESETASEAEPEELQETGENSPELDWEDTFETASSPADRPDNDDAPDIDARNSIPTSLRDHLLWQMQMTPFSKNDRQIAITLIDSINEDGYLSTPLEDIQQAAAQTLGEEVEIDEIEAVLRQIQNFDPLGVGARSLGECLRLQLRAMDKNAPHHELALRLTESAILPLLGTHDWRALKRELKLPVEEIEAAVQIIQKLNPRPGNAVQSTTAQYIVPDILVRRVRGVWRSELNSNASPRLRVARNYESMIRRGGRGADNRYLQDRLQEARWLIKSLASRNETLLKVSRAIVDRQRAFFDHGPEAMKPLVLHDIASVVEMHESTISRVTTQKFMLTPRGIFELKYFFSSHVNTTEGGTCSSTAIRSLIKKMVETENAGKPISDSRIADILGEQGIQVARRTVAKYRESLNIRPSSQRRSLLTRPSG